MGQTQLPPRSLLRCRGGEPHEFQIVSKVQGSSKVSNSSREIYRECVVFYHWWWNKNTPNQTLWMGSSKTSLVHTQPAPQYWSSAPVKSSPESCVLGFCWVRLKKEKSSKFLNLKWRETFGLKEDNSQNLQNLVCQTTRFQEEMSSALWGFGDSVLCLVRLFNASANCKSSSGASVCTTWFASCSAAMVLL